MTGIQSNTPAREIPPLRRGFFWTALGSSAQAGYQWGVTVILAWFCSPDAVGRYAFALAVVSPIFAFTNLQLRAVQATEVKDHFRLRDFLTLRSLSTATGLIGILGTMIAVEPDLGTIAIVMIIALEKGFENFSDVAYGLWQRHERLDLMSVSRILRGTVSIALVLVVVWYTRSALAAAIGLLLAASVTLLCFDAVVTRRHLPEVFPLGGWSSWGRTSRLIQLSFPLGLVTALNSLNLNIPNYFVKSLGGASSLGYYSAVSYLSLVGGIAVGALGDATIHRLSHYYGHSRGQYERSVLALVGLSTCLAAAGVIASMGFGRSILSFVYGDTYGEKAGLLFWLMLGAGLMYIVQTLGCAVTAARYFRVQVPMSLAAIGVRVLACAWWIPREGLLGAAWAVCASNCVMLLCVGGIFVHAVRSAGKRDAEHVTGDRLEKTLISRV